MVHYPAPARYAAHPSQLVQRPDGVTWIDDRALGHSSWDAFPHMTYAQAAARLGEGSLVDTSADGRTIQSSTATR